MNIPHLDVPFLHLPYVARILIDGIRRKVIPSANVKKDDEGKNDQASEETAIDDEKSKGKKE